MDSRCGRGRWQPAGHIDLQDGAQQDQQSWTKENIVPERGTAPVRIATRDLNSFFLGAIREVRVWNRVLTAHKVQMVYTPVESALVRVVIAGGVIWFLIMTTLVLTDYITRGWLPFPGK